MIISFLCFANALDIKSFGLNLNECLCLGIGHFVFEKIFGSNSVLISFIRAYDSESLDPNA